MFVGRLPVWISWPALLIRPKFWELGVSDIDQTYFFSETRLVDLSNDSKIV